MPSEKKQTSSFQGNERMLLSFFHSKKKFLTDFKKHCCETSKAKDFYFHILAKMKEAVIKNKVDDFVRLCDVIDYMNNVNITRKEFLNDEGNPFFDANLIILSCKHNRPRVLKYLFQSNCKVLGILAPETSASDAYHPDLMDSEQHNAFYYAIQSSNIDVLSTLIDQWPGICFSSNPQKLDKLLSKAYEELKLKRVFLSEEMEIFVESKLLDLQFFSENSVSVKPVESDINSIIERTKLVLEKICFLKSEYTNADVDEIFLLDAKFIAQNLYVLKRQLKSTYSRLPWEEVEFCLICFVLSCVKIHEMNVFFKIHLSKSLILRHLKIFAEELDKIMFKEHVSIHELSTLPNKQRDLIVAQITLNNPEFSELYKVYKKVRDLCSLEKIRHYLKLAISANSSAREGQLSIIRALQAVGEYFKNTLESPNLSETVKELLLSSLPRNTRKVIIDLRNALSHSGSLMQRIGIEEKADISFFSGIQNDAKIIENLVADILFDNKVECIEYLLKKITSAESIDDLRAVLKTFDNLDFNLEEEKCSNVSQQVIPQEFLSPKSSHITKQKKLQKMIAELKEKVTALPNSEKQLLNVIHAKMESLNIQSEDTGLNYTLALSFIPSFFHTLHDTVMDSNTLRGFKFQANQALQKIHSKIKPLDLKNIIDLSMCLCVNMISKLSEKGERLDEIHKLMNEFIYFAEAETNDIQWIQKLRQNLSGKGPFFSVDTPKSTFKGTAFKNNYKLNLKLNELRHILEIDGFGGETTGRLISLTKQKEIRTAVEMLLLDVLSILGDSKKYLEKNLFYLDDHVPLLIGKCLRDHLAHDNALVDLSSLNPAFAVILNAKKLISIENVLTSKYKIGKFVQDSPSFIKTKHDRKLAIVSNQEKMFAALAEGNLPLLETCLQNGADFNARNTKRQTALHFAAMGSNVEVLEMTLGRILNPNEKDSVYQTPLHVAAEHGNSRIIELLLKNTKIHVDETDAFLKTPLHLAAKNGHKETVQVLLANKASTFLKDAGGNTALHASVFHNHLEVVKVLLEKEANVDSNQTSGGYTCLHIATEFGFLDLVNFLLLNNANPNALTDLNRAPLHSTALNGHLEVLQVLIKYGADVNLRVLDGCTSLHYAVETGREQVTLALLQHGADPNICDKEIGNGPLHYAAQDGHEGITNILLDNGANVNVTTLRGETPLHLAAHNGHLKIVATLLKHGANIHARNCCCSTPLHLAGAQGHLEIVKLLVKNGADVNMENTLSPPPLLAAASGGHEHVIKFLIKNKAKVNARHTDGSTALQEAALKGKVDAIRILLQNGAKVSTEDHKDVVTPIDAAITSGCKDSVELLINNNADVNKSSYFCRAISGGHEQIVQLLLEKKCQAHSKMLKDGSALYLAIHERNKKIVELLIKYGADVNASESSSTPLIWAVQLNEVEIVELLLAHGAYVNENKKHPLSLAILFGFQDIIEALLKDGAHIHCKEKENITFLHLAAMKGDERSVSALIRRGAEVNAVNVRNETPLFMASAGGHEEVVKILIANNADVNIMSDSGTALHFAVGGKHAEVVEILLKNGAKVETKDNKNRTPLELAIARADLQIAKMLFQQSEVTINAQGNDGFTMLHIAAQEKNVEIVKFLVDNGANMNARNNLGSKPIHIAAREGKKDILEFFLSKGLSINEIGAVGQTPLHYAAMKGQLEVINYLLTNGADINYKDLNGLGPVHIAAAHSTKETVKILLKYGARFDSVTHFGVKLEPTKMTKDKDVLSLLASTESLLASVRQNNAVLVRKFIKEGAFIDVRHSKYGTPLHYAVWKGYDEIINCLLENNANPNIAVDKGFFPLHYAAKYSQFKAVILLLQKGAIYDCASDSKQTPLELSKDKKITKILETLDQAFSDVKNSNIRVISNLKRITDKEVIKAVMRARCKKNHTLIVAGILNNFPKVDQLKQAFQGNVSIKSAVTLSSNSIMLELESILDRRKDILGDDNPGTLDVQVEIAELHYSNGNYIKAYNILDVVCKKFVETLGINNEDVLHAKSMFALVLHRMERNEEAFSIFQEIYPKQKELLGPNHKNTEDTLFHLALVMERLGKHEEALSINTNLFESKKRLLGENNAETIRARNNMALVLLSQGKTEEALFIFRQVLEKKKLILGIQNRDTMRTYCNIANILSNQKKSEEALRIFKEILDIQKKFLGPNHPDNLHIKFAIAEELFKQGNHVSSFKAFKELCELGNVFHGADEKLALIAKQRMEMIILLLKLSDQNMPKVLGHLEKNIFIAASDGDLPSIQTLLKNGVNINEKDIDGRSPLHYAISYGHASIVKFFLDNKADPSQTTLKGNTPLHTAVAKGQKKIVEMLLQKVARDKLNHLVNFGTTSSMTTALHIAAKNGSLEIVKLLLKNGAMFNVKSKENQTPFNVATDQNILTFLKLTEDLFESAERGTNEIIKKLKAVNSDDFNALSNARNSHGNTLLTVAIAKKHKHLVSQLLNMLKHQK